MQKESRGWEFINQHTLEHQPTTRKISLLSIATLTAPSNTLTLILKPPCF